MSKEDNQLIKASIKNSQEAQTKLYKKYEQKWFMVCLRYASNKMEAEDIFQNGLMSIFKNLKQFNQNKAAFYTWSNRIMVNAALQYFRKNNPKQNINLSLEEGYDHGVDADVYSKIGAQELTKMIQLLPEGYRIVFNMYVIEGYKHNEIAEQLNISVSTSKSQLFKAKKVLRNKLELMLQK